jgi:hypothetical protein
MSTTRRAYDILRGYIGREWERIQSIEESSARTELNESLKTPVPTNTRSADPVPTTASPEDQEAYARRLLGVTASATFDEIRKQFERLNRRSDPANFPAGSAEADQAAGIQKRVHWAYGYLTEHMDTTEKRFRSLEI